MGNGWPIAYHTHTYLCELCDLLALFYWDMGRKICRSAVLLIILLVRSLQRTVQWMSWMGHLFFLFPEMKDWWPTQQKTPLQAPCWACYPLSSKYQLELKGVPGPLASSRWPLHSMLLYGTSSGTIIRWSCKEFTVHVWIATLFGSWCHSLSLVPSHYMAFAAVCWHSKHVKSGHEFSVR